LRGHNGALTLRQVPRQRDLVAPLYALTLHRDMFRFVAERRHIARINIRISREIEAGKVERAMDRLHGLISRYPDNMGLRRRLGIYLMDSGHHAEAGRASCGR